MVAESPEAKVERSLVAIPTTGKDRAAKPFVMDLGNLSTEASSVSVDQTFPSPERMEYPGTKSRPAAPPKVNSKLQGPKGVKVVFVKAKHLTTHKSVEVQDRVVQAVLKQLVEERNQLMGGNSGLGQKLMQFERLRQRNEDLCSGS